MEAPFWHERWADNRIGFHQQKVNSRLIRLWPQLGLEAGAGVFVPLCGKSRDMLWLAQQGFRVIGVELSETACEAFFSENDLPFDSRHQGAFRVYEGDGIRLLAGDFFALDKADLDGASAMYDRAALIALPQSLRPIYARQMALLCPAEFQGLCICMSYDETKMQGPPFSVGEEEIRRLFEPAFDLDVIARSSGPGIVGNLADRGLDTLQEKVYHLVRRSS